MIWIQRFIIAILVISALLAMLISTEADLIMSTLQAANKANAAAVAAQTQINIAAPSPQPPSQVIMAPTRSPATFTPTPRLTATPAPVSRPTSTLAPTPLPIATIAPLSVAIASATASPAPTVCTDSAGKVIEDSLSSRVLGHKISVQIYLPPCYAPAKQQYPTLYLIQGRFYIWGEWEDDGVVDVANALINAKTVAPFIMVMPFNDIEMGNASKYLYSNNGLDSWEDFVVSDLVPYVDKTYATARNREMRAIGGISRGGYWATVIGFSHPELFSIIGGHSPAISADFFDLPEDFSVMNYSPSLAQLRTQRVWLDVGNEDLPSYAGPNDLYQKLLAAGVSARFSVGMGAHSDVYWASRMKEYVQFYAEKWPKK